MQVGAFLCVGPLLLPLLSTSGTLATMQTQLPAGSRSNLRRVWGAAPGREEAGGRFGGGRGGGVLGAERHRAVGHEAGGCSTRLQWIPSKCRDQGSCPCSPTPGTALVLGLDSFQLCSCCSQKAKGEKEGRKNRGSIQQLSPGSLPTNWNLCPCHNQGTRAREKQQWLGCSSQLPGPDAPAKPPVADDLLKPLDLHWTILWLVKVTRH